MPCACALDGFFLFFELHTVTAVTGGHAVLVVRLHRSLVGIAGSNPARGMEYCVLRGRGL